MTTKERPYAERMVARQTSFAWFCRGAIDGCHHPVNGANPKGKASRAEESREPSCSEHPVSGLQDVSSPCKHSMSTHPLRLFGDKVSTKRRHFVIEGAHAHLVFPTNQWSWPD